MAQNSGWGAAHGGGAPYGGAPGWGWTPPPEEPKPGVIPLRPLLVGDILGGAVATVSRYWKPLLGVAGVVYGGATAVLGAALVILYAVLSDRMHTVFDASGTGADIGWHEAGPLVLSFLGVIAGAVLLLLICTAVVYASCAAILQDAVLGRPATFRSVWRRSWDRVPSVIGTLLLSGLVVMVPLLLIASVAGTLIAVAVDHHSPALAIVAGVVGGLALAPPAMWLWVLLTLAPAAAVFERQGPVGALRRSARLVRGAWWRTFGVAVLGLVIGGSAGYFVQLPISALGMFSSVHLQTTVRNDPTAVQALATLAGYLSLALLGQMLSQIVAATFPQLITGLLYVDRRIRKEDLAPALAGAAARDAGV